MTSKKKYTSLLWKCPICLDTLQEPMLTSCCGQSFCKVCLDACLSKVDACPMCREPLLSGQHSYIKNRALEDVLTNIKSTNNTDANSTQELILSIQDLELEEEEEDKDIRKKRKKKSKKLQQQQLHLLTRIKQFFIVCTTCHLTRQIRQWQHWCRIHWSMIQCVFYVFLFFFFVFFLRVQEEEFSEHQYDDEKQETKSGPFRTTNIHKIGGQAQ